MGFPHTIAACCDEWFNTACGCLNFYNILTHGAANLIYLSGTEEQKSLYLPKMFSGTWSGTMCITELDAGSDVGSLKSKAVPCDDGAYLIKGQKIFISGGEHNLTDNIIHIVLARIEGDPEGVKGLTTFIVPKNVINSDGSIGENNDVVCAGIEHKMGIHGLSTATLFFGDNGKCKGYIVGGRCNGMKTMFLMMNASRNHVSNCALAFSSAAYMHAASYAKTRVQGKESSQIMNPAAPSVTIINHPDVKRMLLRLKSYVEGMRQLMYLLSWYMDIEKVSDGDSKREAAAMVEMLVPICKAGNTDTVWDVTSEAIQIFGGVGYCADYPVEQFARDCKLLSIVEGTNGIQSIDLVMRKILMNKEQYNYKTFLKNIMKTIVDAKKVVPAVLIEKIENAVTKMNQCLTATGKKLMSGNISGVSADTRDIENGFFLLSLAWMHLWSLTLTIPKQQQLIGTVSNEERKKILAENSEAAFYEGKVLASRFFIMKEFNKYSAYIDAVMSEDTAVLDAVDDIYTGMPVG
jgi:alkylation response protein AidB-like acyl-CoA dehydrogenase